MNIRRMLPIGNVLRTCVVCGYPITAKSDVLTAHEVECLNLGFAMAWRAEGTLILNGDLVVGSVVDHGGDWWSVEILRFDGDRTFRGTYEACLGFIEGVLGEPEKREPRPL
jgi:hypothetical protein